MPEKIYVVVCALGHYGDARKQNEEQAQGWVKLAQARSDELTKDYDDWYKRLEFKSPPSGFDPFLSKEDLDEHPSYTYCSVSLV